jgi:predicted RNase H-like HicB family nuclease
MYRSAHFSKYRNPEAPQYRREKMEIPIAIHKDPGSVYGVTVPDVEGCFAAGNTIEEAVKNARSAIYAHIETMLELGDSVDVKASSIADLASQEDYAGAIWALVDVDLSKLDPTPERVNISLPRFVLGKIDTHAAARNEKRSGFLARAALAVIAEESKPRTVELPQLPPILRR